MVTATYCGSSDQQDGEPLKLLGLLITTGLLSAFLTGVLRRYALNQNLMDIPNDRSSHSSPTPRGGGLSIVVAYSAAILVLFFGGQLTRDEILVMVLASGVVAGVGFWDDHGHVAILWRLMVHGLAALILVVVLIAPNIGPGITFALAAFAVALGVTWMVNLYNFMDGIDGIAAVEAITVSLAAAALAWSAGATGIACSLLSLGAAGAGFLVWNWPPAKVFMGDVGSGFLGAIFAVIVLITVTKGMMSLWSWIILLAVFWVDATVTLVRRVLSRQVWYSAHRSHAYQRAARRYGHRVVTLSTGVINLVFLLPLAFAAAVWPELAVLATAAAVVPLIGICLFFGAGKQEP